MRNIISHGKRMVREDLIKKLLNGDYSVKLKDITNIQSLTDEQINELKAGDVIVKKTGDQTHAYLVTYKEENQGICFSYFDATVIETVSYDYTDGHWVYNSTDISNQEKLHLYRIEFIVEIEGTQGDFVMLFYSNKDNLTGEDLNDINQYEYTPIYDINNNFVGYFFENFYIEDNILECNVYDPSNGEMAADTGTAEIYNFRKMF